MLLKKKSRKKKNVCLTSDQMLRNAQKSRVAFECVGYGCFQGGEKRLLRRSPGCERPDA